MGSPALAGSSPGGWGEERPDARPRRNGRFIPRRLGRGSTRSFSRSPSSVHPQAAGEREVRTGRGDGTLGSSPGGWGEEEVQGRGPAPLRFIPRRLGRGTLLDRCAAPTTVHPQAAGERTSISDSASAFVGSSPGGWGEEGHGLGAGQADRFIPRRLGRGALPPPPAPRSSVHPQAAGERESLPSCPGLASGSSPGGWGEVLARPRMARPCRFIPRRLGRGVLP